MRVFPACALEFAPAFDPGLVQIAYRQEILRDLPRAYIRQFAMGGYTPFQDQSLYSDTVTAVNAPSTTAGGPLGEAYPFVTGVGNVGGSFYNGANQYLSFTNGVFDDIYASWTLESWVYVQAARHDFAAVISREYGASPIPFALMVGNPNLLDGTLANVDTCMIAGFYTGPAGTPAASWAIASDGVAITLNTWIHWAATWDGVTIRIYKNGAQVASRVPGYAVSASSGLGTFVARRWDTGGTTPFLQAALAETAIYPRQLSADRIGKHYAAAPRLNPDASLAGIPWCNIGKFAKQIGTARGRQHELNRVETGTATLLLENTPRQFEPEFAGDIPPGNGIVNPTFLVNITGWSSDATVTGLAQQAAGGVDNSGYASGAAAVAASYIYPSADAIAVTPGKTYTFMAFFKRGTRNGNCHIEAQWKGTPGDAGATLSQPTVVTQAVTVAGGWTFLVGTAVAPAGAFTVRPFLFHDGCTAGDTISWDHCAVREGNYAAQGEAAYFDGDSENARWNTTRGNSKSVLGGPYYPNIIPMRRVRFRAAYPAQMVPNGSFERSASSIAPWTTSIAGAATTAFEPTGGDALGAATNMKARILFTSPAGGATDQGFATSDYIPVDASKPYSVAAFFFKSGAGNPYTAVRVNCYSDKKDYLGYCAPAGLGADGNFAMTGTAQWEKHGGVIQGISSRAGVGAFLRGTKYVQVQVFAFYNPARAYTGTVYIDDVSLTPGPSMFPDASYFIDASGDYNASDAWAEMYNGYVEGFPLSWPSNRRGRVSVNCVDGFEPLSMANLSVPVPVSLSGMREQMVLDGAGWPRSERRVQVGQSQVQATNFGNNLTQPSTHAADIADTEGGLFYIGADGQAVYEDRGDRVSGGANALNKATFGDGDPATGELPYLPGLAPNFGVEQVYNRVIVTPNGLAAQTAEDATSQQEYWLRELSKATWHTSTGDAAGVASVLLGRYKQPLLRFDEISYAPKRDARLWLQALRRELSHRITVVRRPQGTPNAITKAVHIERIAHTAKFEETVDWTVEYQLSPADTQSYWIMDTSALDTGTRLAL